MDLNDFNTDHINDMFNRMSSSRESIEHKVFFPPFLFWISIRTTSTSCSTTWVAVVRSLSTIFFWFFVWIKIEWYLQSQEYQVWEHKLHKVVWKQFQILMTYIFHQLLCDLCVHLLKREENTFYRREYILKKRMHHGGNWSLIRMTYMFHQVLRALCFHLLQKKREYILEKRMRYVV